MKKSDAEEHFPKRPKASHPNLAEYKEMENGESHLLRRRKTKVRTDGLPFQVDFNGSTKSINLYPEKLIDGKTSGSYIIFEPGHYFSSISGFFRLQEGEKITIGGRNEQQRVFLETPRHFSRRQLSIANLKGELIFKNHAPKNVSCKTMRLTGKQADRLADWRLAKVKRLQELFGGSIRTLDPDTALSLLRDVNVILEDEAHRPKDRSGLPGGLITLPDQSVCCIVGDLHAKTDNLLVILSQDGYLEALEAGNGFLVILGDAVHPEGDGPLDEMESSMLIMDLILKLKLQFPSQVFYVRGNHDSFSEDMAKGGIPQGLLWEQQLEDFRGKPYRNEMERFYDLLPYVAVSKHFVTCHAAPTIGSTSTDELVNIRDNPRLVNQLINNRLRSPKRPSGYTKRDVNNFRKSLKLGVKTPFIVGHTPLSNHETIWENVGGIENHHILYSSDTTWVGVMTQIGDRVYPLKYPTEPMTSFINSFSD